MDSSPPGPAPPFYFRHFTRGPPLILPARRLRGLYPKYSSCALLVDTLAGTMCHNTYEIGPFPAAHVAPLQTDVPEAFPRRFFYFTLILPAYMRYCAGAIFRASPAATRFLTRYVKRTQRTADSAYKSKYIATDRLRQRR